jgi:uncharacterized phage-associated protein
MILERMGPMSAMKLQKLLYYTQAWSLVWDDEPLFQEEIEAWANGPVVPTIYSVHRGQFSVERWPMGNPARLDESQRETVDSVLQHYGSQSAQWLSDLTHDEQPWQAARAGLSSGARSNTTISLASLAEYYGSL